MRLCCAYTIQENEYTYAKVNYPIALCVYMLLYLFCNRRNSLLLIITFSAIIKTPAQD